MKRSKGEYAFDFLNVVYMAIVGFCMVYPFYYCIVNAFNEGQDARRGGIWFWPRIFTWANFEQLFVNPVIGHAIFMSIFRTVMGVLVGVTVTGMFSYVVSRKNLVLKRFYIFLGSVTMFFSGGLIPSFLLLTRLGFYNNVLVYILPYMFSMSNAIMMIAFFKGVPDELIECAYIDGAQDIRIFFQIIVPISKPILATIALFLGVMQWNSWLDTIIYTNSPSLQTLSSTLRQMMNQITYYENLMKEAMATGQMASEAYLRMRSVTSRSFMMAMIVITSLPIMCIYPFIQQYLVKGVMIGSLKG